MLASYKGSESASPEPVSSYTSFNLRPLHLVYLALFLSVLFVAGRKCWHRRWHSALWRCCGKLYCCLLRRLLGDDTTLTLPTYNNVARQGNFANGNAWTESGQIDRTSLDSRKQRRLPENPMRDRDEPYGYGL